MSAAPEAILLELLGNDPAVAKLIRTIGPLVVPFETLVHSEGWLLNFSGDTSQDALDNPYLDAELRELRWMLIACDYAVRRGASDAPSASKIIARESPVAFEFGDQNDHPVLNLASDLGLITPGVAPFARRSLGHTLASPYESDPVLSFEEGSVDFVWGDNALSSFVVHPKGERDGVSVIGKASERWAVEIGLDPQVEFGLLTSIEEEIALMPSFLGGCNSELRDGAIVLGWSGSGVPDPHAIAVTIHAWTRALFDLDLVDVRIVFAPSRGRSAILTDMRARAKVFRLYRNAVNAGHPDPRSVVTVHQDQTQESL